MKTPALLKSLAARVLLLRRIGFDGQRLLPNWADVLIGAFDNPHLSDAAREIAGELARSRRIDAAEAHRLLSSLPSETWAYQQVVAMVLLLQWRELELNDVLSGLLELKAAWAVEDIINEVDRDKLPWLADRISADSHLNRRKKDTLIDAVQQRLRGS